MTQATKGEERRLAAAVAAEAGEDQPRDASGRFLSGRGSSLASYQSRVSEALRQRFPPDAVADMAAKALEAAVEWKSWRGILAVAEFVAQRTLGRPAQSPAPSDAASARLAQLASIIASASASDVASAWSVIDAQAVAVTPAEDEDNESS